MKLKFKWIFMCAFILIIFGVHRTYAVVDGIYVRNNSEEHFMVDKGVRVIPTGGLAGITATKITIPETVEVVESGALGEYNYKVRRINLGARVVKPYAFIGAYRWIEIGVMSSVENLSAGITYVPDQNEKDPEFNNGLIDKILETPNPAYIVDKNNNNYSSDEFGILYNKDKTVLISVPSFLYGAFVTPRTVKYICEGCFVNLELQRVVITDNVNKVSDKMYQFAEYKRGFSKDTKILFPNSILNTVGDKRELFLDIN